MDGDSAGAGSGARTGTCGGAVRHVARFSADAGDLAEAAAFLAGSLTAGGFALALVSPGSRAALGPGLAQAGVNVAAAVRRGDLVLREADRALDAVTVGGEVDAIAFGHELGSVVGQMTAGGRTVHVYGEMVDLLWRGGNAPGVLRLEALWDEVAAGTGTSVLCGWAADATHDVSDVLRRVCELHGAVTGPGVPAAFAAVPELEASATFGALPEAPRAARRWVVDALRAWPPGTDGLLDDAALVVTELAANAVHHTGSAFTVRVEASGCVVRIVVEDGEGGTRAVVPSRLPVLSTSGRGLQIVAGLVSRWGVDAVPGGKLVWAELTVAAGR